jgi:hypothetical protein
MNYLNELESRWQFKDCGRSTIHMHLKGELRSELLYQYQLATKLLDVQCYMFDEPGSGCISDTGSLAGISIGPRNVLAYQLSKSSEGTSGEVLLY